MNDHEVDDDVRGISRRLALLAQQVDVNSGHKNQLRDQLLRRHGELAAGHRRKPFLFARNRRWVRRLTFVGGPALAIAAAFSVVLSGLQISGHQTPQAVEAARLTNALARTAPTVTSWQVAVKQERNNTTSFCQCRVPLGPGERLYVRAGHAYLFTRNTWYEMSQQSVGKHVAFAWQWSAFAVLPARLASRRFVLLREKTIRGETTEGIQYEMRTGAATWVTVTSWVDQRSGLVSRLEQVVRRNGKIVEHDVADYRYVTSG